VSYKVFIAKDDVVDKLHFPNKTDRLLGSRKDDWCEFHRAQRHNVERCLTLTYQLSKLVKEGFLTKYIENGLEEPNGEAAPQEKSHEASVLGDLNTIAGVFSERGSSTSNRKCYSQAMMSQDTKKPEQSSAPSLCFTSTDSKDVFPHEDDLVVISIITIGRNVHKVLIDQGSSTDVMFWETFEGLQISPD